MYRKKYWIFTKKNRVKSNVFTTTSVKLTKQTKMNCKTVFEKLISYSNGELNDPENEMLKTHLENCRSCNNLYTELETTLNLIEKKKTLEPNPFLYTRIKQRLDAIEHGTDRPVFIPIYKKVFQPVLLSFLLVSGMFLGIKLGNICVTNHHVKISESQTTEFYFNDFQQEKLEVLLLTE